LIILKIKKLVDNVKTPIIIYNNRQAGIDFFTYKDYKIKPKSFLIIDLGISIKPVYKLLFKYRKLFYKIYMQLQGRSGLAFNKGLELTNASVIDEDYNGNIKIKIYNTTNDIITIEKDTKIVQGIIIEIPKVKIKEVKEIKNKKKGRNSQGFGSSDIK